MFTVKSHRSVFFDVDDTLIIWDWQSVTDDMNELITIVDPESGHTEMVLPHQRHIQLLKQFKARGHTVVVWSAGGWAWAESVVKQLGLEDLVDVTMAKPDWYVDDLPASAYMGRNIYKHPSDSTKDVTSWDTDEAK